MVARTSPTTKNGSSRTTSFPVTRPSFHQHRSSRVAGRVTAMDLHNMAAANSAGAAAWRHGRGDSANQVITAAK